MHRVVGEICVVGSRRGRFHLVDLIPDQQGSWKTKPLEFRLALPKLLVHFGRNLTNIVECLAQLRRDIGVQPRRARQALAIFGETRLQLRHQIEHAAEQGRDAFNVFLRPLQGYIKGLTVGAGIRQLSRQFRATGQIDDLLTVFADLHRVPDCPVTVGLIGISITPVRFLVLGGVIRGRQAECDRIDHGRLYIRPHDKLASFPHFFILTATQ